MSLIALILVILLSALIVKIGSIALRMTGIDRETARFQSLSAFTGTGFTTSEAENIVNHPQRRKVIKTLMVLGNAGIVSAVAMLIISFKGNTLTESLAKLGILGLAGLGILIFSLVKGLENIVDTFIEKRLSSVTHFSMGGLSEVIRLARGYGIFEIAVTADHPLAGSRLMDTDLSKKEILVLAIKRGFNLIPAPKATEVIEPGDRLVCFGLSRNITELAATDRSEGGS